MCKYTINNLDSNTFLKKCWRNVRLELRMHYDVNCGAFIFLLIVRYLQRDVRIRDFLCLFFGQQYDKNCIKKGAGHIPQLPENLYTNGSHHRTTKVVDFVRFCNSGYCLPSVIGLASSCFFCSSLDNIFIMASTLSLMIMILSLATLIPYRILSNMFIQYLLINLPLPPWEYWHLDIAKVYK